MKQSTIGQGIFPVNKSAISTDVIAGITLGALAIPEVLGYTKISGTPLITGLYTLLIPMILYAFFGSSRHLVVGADSATAAILAASLVGIAATGSHEYVALSGLLAIMSAGLLILARVVGLGFMADFLSRTVLIGFLTGVGIHISLGQVHGMIATPGDLTLAVIVIAIVFGSKKFSPKIPGALIAVTGIMIVSWIFNFKDHGFRTLGAIPQGLPSIGLPDVQWSLALILKLLPTAFSMFVVILAQSAATSRAYAARYSEPFSENIDLVGLGLANIGAALSGAFVVNGSPTKTQMVDSAGGRSQLAQLTTSLIVLLVLLFFTGPLSILPTVVLLAVVFVIGLELIDFKGMVKIWQQRRPEFWVALITTFVVVFVGVEQGIVIAMLLSLIEHVRRSYRSQNVVLTMDKATGSWHLLPISAPQQVEPGLILYRFAHTIYYANAPQLYDQIITLAQTANPSLRWFCIDASAVADVDFTAAETLREVFGILKGKGIRLVWVNLIDPVRQEFDRYEITELIGKDAFYSNFRDVLKAYRSTFP